MPTSASLDSPDRVTGSNAVGAARAVAVAVDVPVVVVDAATTLVDEDDGGGVGDTRSTTPPSPGSAGGVGCVINCNACFGAASALFLATISSGWLGLSVSAVAFAASCTKT
jgi:hypothetical protein